MQLTRVGRAGATRVTPRQTGRPPCLCPCLRLSPGAVLRAVDGEVGESGPPPASAPRAGGCGSLRSRSGPTSGQRVVEYGDDAFDASCRFGCLSQSHEQHGNPSPPRRTTQSPVGIVLASRAAGGQPRTAQRQPIDTGVGSRARASGSADPQGLDYLPRDVRRAAEIGHQPREGCRLVAAAIAGGHVRSLRVHGVRRDSLVAPRHKRQRATAEDDGQGKPAPDVSEATRCMPSAA